MFLSNADSKNLVKEGEYYNPQDEEWEISEYVSDNLLNKHHDVLEGINKDDDVHGSDDHTKDDVNVYNGYLNLVSHVFLLMIHVLGIIR